MTCIYNPPADYWLAANDDKIGLIDHTFNISANHGADSAIFKAASANIAASTTQFHVVALKALEREISKYAQGDITKQTLGMFKSRLNSKLIPYFGGGGSK